METEENVNDELRKLVPGFPVNKTIHPPQDYFEKLPEEVLNRWREEESQYRSKRLPWRKIISIAAVFTGLCVGGMWYITKTAPGHTTIHQYSSIEAYQYVHENIEEFESLIETEDIPFDESIDLPENGIEDYLMEEIELENDEDLF